MPFINKNTIGIGRLLCIKQEGIWKLHAQLKGKFIRVGLPFTDDVVECSPTFHQDRAGIIRASVIAGGSPTDAKKQRYYLYTFRMGADLKIMDFGQVAPSFAGCVSSIGVATINSEAKKTTLQHQTLKKEQAWLVNGRIYRVSYHPTKHNQLLVSGAIDREEFSVLLDIETNRQWDLICDGHPAYKFAIDPQNEGRIEYALRKGQSFENREVVSSTDIQWLSHQTLTEVMA